MDDADTIAAVATAAGRGGIGVVRISGPRVPQIAADILGKQLPPRTACVAAFRAADGEAIDRGIAIYFPAPASYTGEDVLELQGHGGSIVQSLVLKRCLELGARLAQPGEFSRRAYLNDKIDLAQAEAIADLVDAATERAARSATRSLAGEFSRRVAALQAVLTEVRAGLEAEIDFPDEGLDLDAASKLEQRPKRRKVYHNQCLVGGRGRDSKPATRHHAGSGAKHHIASRHTRADSRCRRLESADRAG
jgi:tRNA modification GTPase